MQAPVRPICLKFCRSCYKVSYPVAGPYKPFRLSRYIGEIMQHVRLFLHSYRKANIGQARQPARAAALGIPRGDAGAVQGFVRTPLSRQHLDEVQKTRHQRIRLLTYLAIELLARGQRGEGGAQMTASIAVKTALTAKTLPLPKEGQGHSLTPAKSRLWSRMGLGRQGGLAHIIHHDVKSSQEG